MTPRFHRASLAVLAALFLPPEAGSYVKARGGLFDRLSWLPPSGGSVVLSAQEWPQWRGPSRSGIVAAAGTPKWPAAWARAWRVDVGEGYSSPIVAGGRVFVHSRRDPEETVTAIDLATGKTAWQQKYTAPFSKNKYATSMARGPHATPLAIADKVITVGGTGVVSAWNARTGALVWRKDYSPSVDFSKLFTGTAASPLADGGFVIVQVGSDVHGGRIIALDPQTGAERWTWKGAGPGYASPVVVTAAGSRQIVTMTDSSIEGLDARTGAALWSFPFPDEWHENIVTPIWTGTHLIVSGTRQGTHAFTLRQAAGKWQAAPAWKNAEVAFYMSTPVLADGVIYGLSNKKKGQIVAVDAATGALKWATEGRAADQAAILLTPAHVLILTTGGELVLVSPTPAKYQEQRRYTVAESATWAVPVPLADGLIVRDATGVMRLTAAPAKPGGPSK
jgi:outer membrane protein assembly factor BamB